tara:strand:- start:438 stop:2183 length:1746 start_codon:yes stop_codon:yes gene_type:complete
MVAEPFDRSWDAMVNDPNTPTLATDYDAADIAELGIGVDLADSGGDACCIDAKNKWEEAVIEGFPPGWDDFSTYRMKNPNTGEPMQADEGAAQEVHSMFQEILDSYRDMDCDEFRSHLEERANAARLNPDPTKGLDLQLALSARRILEEWDGCVQETMFGSKVTEDNEMFLSDESVNTPFDSAWMVAKGIVFDGRDYGIEDAGEVYDRISELISDPKTERPPLPWKTSGRRMGIPWKRMTQAKIEGRDPASEMYGSWPGNEKAFAGGEEMLPTVLNWIGGKTQIQPQMRGIARSLGRPFTPAELFGGSGSFILGQNTGDGFYSDLNPDPVTVMRQLQRGLQVPNIPQDHEEMASQMEELNELRYKRDIMGAELSPLEERRLAQLFIGSNLQFRDGMFAYDDWEEEPVRYSEGRIKMPTSGTFRRTKHPEGHPNHRFFPSDAGSIDLRPYADRLKNVEIHEGDFQESAKLLDPSRHLLYLDPQYIERDIEYGGSDKQRRGQDFDEHQKDVIRVGRDFDGPSIISNYMFGKKSRKPLERYIEALVDAGYDIYPWLRKPKQNTDAQAELLALRNFPKQSSLSEY